MFKPLRKKTVVQVTMWVLLVTFVIWGAGSLTMTGQNYVGVVFGKKIMPQEYMRSYTAALNRSKMMYGDKLSQIQKFLNLEGQAWDRLILLYYSKEKGIRASNKDVVAKIAALPFFQSGGTFDKKAYDYIVRYVFATTPREFEESVRDDIVISKIVDSVEKGVSVSEGEIENAYKEKNEKADISYIVISTDSFKESASAEEAELEPFYNSDKERFRAPEKVNVYYVKIPFLKKEGPDDEKGKARKLAEEINDYLNQGEDFDSLGKKYNLEIKGTGPFSPEEPVPGIGLSYPFTITAFGLSKETPNNVVEEAEAFYVIKLKEKLAAHIKPFADAKEDVRSALVLDVAQKLALASAQGYAEILRAKKETLESLSKQLNSQIINLKDIAGESYADDVGFNPEFNKACFTIKEGEFTEPIKIQKGFAIIRLDKLKPIDRMLFEKEKEKFKESLLQGKRQKAFYDWFSRLKKKANLKIKI